MTKDRFCEIIETLRKGDKLVCDVANLIKDYNNDVGTDYPERYGLFVENSILCQELLAEIMDDDIHGGWIDYYCNVLDYGKRWEVGMVEIDGKDYKLSTPEDLWDILTKE